MEQPSWTGAPTPAAVPVSAPTPYSSALTPAAQYMSAPTPAPYDYATPAMYNGVPETPGLNIDSDGDDDG